jgi:hypothetical protein
LYDSSSNQVSSYVYVFPKALIRSFSQVRLPFVCIPSSLKLLMSSWSSSTSYFPPPPPPPP